MSIDDLLPASDANPRFEPLPVPPGEAPPPPGPEASVPGDDAVVPAPAVVDPPGGAAAAVPSRRSPLAVPVAVGVGVLSLVGVRRLVRRRRRS